MCGNGGRCAARFAFLKGIAGEKMSFETVAGIIDAEVRGDVVKLRLTDPRRPRHGRPDPDRKPDPLRPQHQHRRSPCRPFRARSWRDSMFSTPAGRSAVMNITSRPGRTPISSAVVDDHTLRVRTYERGVEDETLACGTGSVASALIAARKGLVESPVDVRVQSGETPPDPLRNDGRRLRRKFILKERPKWFIRANSGTKPG